MSKYIPFMDFISCCQKKDWNAAAEIYHTYAWEFKLEFDEIIRRLDCKEMVFDSLNQMCNDIDPTGGYGLYSHI